MPGESQQSLDDRTFFDRFARELESVKQSRDLLDRSKALIFWFGINYLHSDDEDDIKERTSDGSNDEGIDAVFVDESSRIIHFISAITVDTFEISRRSLSETDLKITFEGFRLVTKGDYRGKVNPILEGLVKEYHELLNSGEGYQVKITFVHENQLPASTKYKEQFSAEFPDVSVEFFDFKKLKQAYNDYLVYQEPPPNRVPLEVIGKILRGEGEPRSIVFTISGKTLATVFLTHGTKIFQRNIRYFLAIRGKRTINAQIEATASDTDRSKRFWYYNNGITVVCSHIDVPPNEQVVILDRMQIINGAQTTYSIVSAYNKNKLQETTKVLVKVIESTDNDFIDDVTLYTNNQNPVNLRDLSSRDEIQTRIQRVFKSYQYFYERKRGEFNALYTTEEIKKKEFGPDWKKRGIPNERAAQAYLAMFLDKPSQAKSQKSRIFLKSQGGFYSDIFNDSLIEERMLVAFKLLEYIERKTNEYSKKYYNAGNLSQDQMNQIYKYDFLLHSDFFILNLFADLLLKEGLAFDRSGCVAILKALENNDTRITNAYDLLRELLLEFIAERRKTDATYYHNKFFKSDGSIGLIRDYLRTQKGMTFIRLG